MGAVGSDGRPGREGAGPCAKFGVFRGVAISALDNSEITWRSSTSVLGQRFRVLYGHREVESGVVPRPTRRYMGAYGGRVFKVVRRFDRPIASGKRAAPVTWAPRVTGNRMQPSGIPSSLAPAETTSQAAWREYPLTSFAREAARSVSSRERRSIHVSSPETAVPIS